MASKSQYVYAEKFGPNNIQRYVQKSDKGPEIVAFLFPAVKEYYRSEITGKTVLDIACGKGIWSYIAAQYSPKSVDGFDIDEEMVKLAKQATSEFNTASIRIGDVRNMPYDDNMFDVVSGMHVTCALKSEVCITLFKEIHRVLVPGGKALLNCLAKSALEKLVVRSGDDKALIDKEISKKLMNLTSFPSDDEINNAFQDFPGLIHVFFTLDENGRLHRVSDADKLTNGQAVWSTCRTMAYVNYYYDEQFFQQQIKAAGLKLDKIENYYTEERRIAYNNTDSEFELDKGITDTPTFVMYHLSKPID